MKFCRTFLTTVLLFCALPVMAYQTVVMDFPGNWHKVKYIQNDTDAIVQFVRSGYNLQNYTETVVFHTFKWSQTRNMSAYGLMNYLIKDVQRKNNTLKIQYITMLPEETLVSWCVSANRAMPAHCELLRTTQSFEGALSMHYINKNPENFYAVRKDWIDRLSKARVYQSYFRLDRILNKAMTFEL